MNLCSNEHQEVCYEGRVCPLCEMRDELQGEIDYFKEALDEAQTKPDEQ